MNLRQNLTFGFEQTFTIENWWEEPGFVSTSDTPLKRQKMKELADDLTVTCGGSVKESKDIYNHLQYETFDSNGDPLFVVTMDPGSIEVKTPPLMIADIESFMSPLFLSAERVGLKTYRQWWYGVKGGTEGGCHINMAGRSLDSNPFYLNPKLTLQYLAFYQNRPWLHYPFMGIDVGPGGNAMRMDEYETDGDPSTIIRFNEFAQKINSIHCKVTPQNLEEQFKGSHLYEDRHSAPSLYKYKKPLYMLEDRAVEAFYTASEIRLLCELRVKILEYCLTQSEVEEIKNFGDALHTDYLHSLVLWDKFQETLNQELKMDSKAFKCFFLRHFPDLKNGQNVPQFYTFKLGRRPRKITGIQKRGELVISKTIDTHFNRFELQWDSIRFPNHGVKINAMECEGKNFSDGNQKVSGLFLDTVYVEKDQVLEVDFFNRKTGDVLEKNFFNLNDLMFQSSGNVDLILNKKYIKKTQAVYYSILGASVV